MKIKTNNNNIVDCHYYVTHMSRLIFPFSLTCLSHTLNLFYN